MNAERKEDPVDTKKTALVIDDDELIRAMINSMLTRMGYRVIPAENGTKALEIAEICDTGIDVVLMDLFLPDVRGDKVCPKILARHPHTKIIVMSGYALEDITVLDTEVHGFIQKPCTFESLEGVLGNVL
jgi:DNA-binding NtrC family response regulator